LRDIEQLAAEDIRLSPVESGARPGGPWPHRKVGRVLRLMAWLAALGTVVTGVAIIMPTLATSSDGLPADLLLLLVCGAAVAASLFSVARGLMKGRRWARLAGILCGTLALVGFPVGTVLGCYMLWQLLFRWHQTGQPAHES
jgi:hypothetical protein